MLIIFIDGTERQVIKDTDGTVVRPKIKACSISDPFILILREDETLGLFVGEAERKRIRRKDMSAMGDKVSTVLFCRCNFGSISLGWFVDLAISGGLICYRPKWAVQSR